MVAPQTALVLCVLLGSGLLLAGCFGDEAPPAPSDAAAEDGRAEDDGAALGPTNTTVDDAVERARLKARLAPDRPEWYLLSLQTGPEGASASHRLPVPPAAKISVNEEPTVVLEVVPILPDGQGAKVAHWGLHGFQQVDGSFEPVGSLVQTRGRHLQEMDESHVPTPVQGTFWDLERHAWNLLPRSSAMYGVEMRGNLTFVFGATADVPLEMGLALRFVTVDDPQDPSEDLDAFAASVDGAEPTPLTPINSSSGYRVAHAYIYSVLTNALAPTRPWTLAHTDTVEVSDGSATTGTGPLVDLTLRFASDMPVGTSLVDGRYHTVSTAGGTYDMTYAIHDVSWDVDGIITPYGGSSSGAPFGIPGFSLGGFDFGAAWSGPGGSAYDIRLTAIDPAALSTLDLRHVTFGMDAAALLGGPLAQWQAAPRPTIG